MGWGWGWGWGDGWNSAKLRGFCEDAEVLKKVVWKSRSGLDWVEVEANVAISVGFRVQVFPSPSTNDRV